MKSVIIPGDAPAKHSLPFYLAVEEWVAANLADAGDWFFAWQVAPTAICGRHQDIPVELDLDFARSRGIEVWRRRSGGGCVYADRANVMFSYITPDVGSGVAGSFARYTAKICSMLAGLGIQASPTGRNDIAIHGRKVAGNAWYRSAGCAIVHGTMLYDADFDTMARLLTPSRAKLLSKGVASVEARVTTLRQAGLSISCDEFVRLATSALCPGGSYALTQSDLAEVEKIAQRYRNPDFLRLDGTGSTLNRHSLRIDRLGELCIGWKPDSAGRMTGVTLTGDCLAADDALRRLQLSLEGRRPAEITPHLIESILS